MTAPPDHGATGLATRPSLDRLLLPLLGLALMGLVSPLLILPGDVLGGAAGFHATLDIGMSLLAIAVGVGLLVRSMLLGRRLLLVAGLAFLILGSQDLTHGLLLTGVLPPRVFGIAEATAPSAMVPVIGQLVFGLILLGGSLSVAGRPERNRPRTGRATLAVVLVTMGIGVTGTLTVFALDLPSPIRPDGPISRPLNLLAGLILVLGAGFLARLALAAGGAMLRWVAYSLTVHAAAQFLMAGSLSPYDQAWYLSHAYAVLGSFIPLLGFLLLQVTDLARAIRAEQRAAAREATLSHAIDAAEVGLWEWDIARGRFAAHGPLCRMLAEPALEEAACESWFIDRLHPADVNAFRLEFSRSLADSSHLLDLEHRVRAGNNTWCWVHTTARVTESRRVHVTADHWSTQPVRMLGQSVDVTVRRALRERERDLARRLQDVAACVPGALYRFRLDQDGAFRFDYLSPGIRDIYGVSDDDAMRSGDLLFALMHPDDISDALERIHAAAASPGPFSMRYRVLRPDGETVHVSARSHARRLRDGSTVWSGYLDDVTDQVRLADANARADSAEAANEAKTAFLAHMSHEIRTPLAAILGYVAELEDESDEAASGCEPTSPPRLDRIRANAELLLGIVDDILDASRVENGDLLVEAIPASVSDIVRASVELVQLRVDEKQLTMTVELGESLPSHVRTDPFRVRQILGNLLRNAVKFTDVGGITLRVEHEPDHEDGPRLRFDVVDTGIGISADRQEAIFDPFVRADESMNRRHGGAGLGLSISRGLARRLGGDVTVASLAGGGSVFTLRIAGVPVTAPVTAEPSQAAAPSIAGCRILLVEDGPDNQRLIGFLLRKAGAAVTVADDGSLGLAEFAAAEAADQPFDLIVTDMQMPVLDGYEMTRRLRDRGVRIPIIAATAHAMVGDRERCLGAGCDDYVTKPIRREVLLETCARWLCGTADAADGADGAAAA